VTIIGTTIQIKIKYYSKAIFSVSKMKTEKNSVCKENVMYFPTNPNDYDLFRSGTWSVTRHG